MIPSSFRTELRGDASASSTEQDSANSSLRMTKLWPWRTSRSTPRLSSTRRRPTPAFRPCNSSAKKATSLLIRKYSTAKPFLLQRKGGGGGYSQQAPGYGPGYARNGGQTRGGQGNGYNPLRGGKPWGGGRGRGGFKQNQPQQLQNQNQSDSNGQQSQQQYQRGGKAHRRPFRGRGGRGN